MWVVMRVRHSCVSGASPLSHYRMEILHPYLSSSTEVQVTLTVTCLCSVSSRRILNLPSSLGTWVTALPSGRSVTSHEKHLTCCLTHGSLPSQRELQQQVVVCFMSGEKKSFLLLKLFGQPCGSSKTRTVMSPTFCCPCCHPSLAHSWGLQ